METLPLFIVLGCSLALNLVLVIVTSCQSSKISKLQNEVETSDCVYNDLREEYLKKHNQLVKTEQNLKQALTEIEQMKTAKSKKVKTAVIAVKTDAATKTTKTTTRKRTAKKEEK